MNLSIRAKLGIIFLGFLVLIFGAVAATFLAIEHQAADALVISLASRQRGLIHNMARAILGLQTDSQRSAYYLDLIELDESAGEFEDVQSAMLHGGTVFYGSQNLATVIPAIDTPAAQEQLERIQALWEPMGISANALLVSATDIEQSRAITEIEFKIPLLLAQIDLLTQILEADAARDLALLKSIQIVFFLSAACLLAGGYIFVKHTILQPLQSLDTAARQIALGDLSQSITLKQHDEIGALARSFETMRQEVAAARRASEVWTAQLESRVQQRTQELSALLEISADISSKLDVDRVLGSVVEKGRGLLGGDVSVLCLLSESHHDLTIASFSGPDAAVVRTRVQVNEGLPADVVDRGQTVTCDACGVCPILAPAYRQELIAAPLRAGDYTIGALCVAYSEPGQLGDDAARLLTLLANSAAIALENARLFSRAEAAAVLAERERIAAEMHDGLAQTLGYLNLQVDQALNSVNAGHPTATREHLRLMHPAIQTSYDTVRQALVGLSDNGLARRGFKAQLETCLAEFRQKSEAEVKLYLDESCLPGIPEKARLQLLRIVQESLTNIHRHAAATEVQVMVGREGDSTVITIVDNGQGYDPAAISNDGQSHLGLKIMRGRAERIGGSLVIQSQPGNGTEVVATVPLQQHQES